MFFVVETIVFGTHTIFSEAETIFFASESGFSLTEKIVGDVPTIFVYPFNPNQSFQGGVLRLTASELRTGSPDSLLNSSLPWPARITGLTNKTQPFRLRPSI